LGRPPGHLRQAGRDPAERELTGFCSVADTPGVNPVTSAESAADRALDFARSTKRNWVI
jgi:hypothetical protein